MSQPVIIKSNKYGINLILDREMLFEELLKAIEDKFIESGNFFKDARLAISFSGRKLSEEEEYRIVDTITSHTDIEIICVVDNNEEWAERVKEQIDRYYDTIARQEGEFYRGNLHAGQILECVGSVVIVGDVRLGSKVISQGNIVILGALKGTAYAGAGGNSNCFIAALEMDPSQLQIADMVARIPDKKSSFRMLRRKDRQGPTADAGIALIKGNGIFIEPFSSSVLSTF